MALDDAERQHFRDLVTAFRTSHRAVEAGANFGDRGGDAEKQHNGRVARRDADAAQLRHFLSEKAAEGVGDAELGKAGSITPKQFAELRSQLA